MGLGTEVFRLFSIFFFSILSLLVFSNYDRSLMCSLTRLRYIALQIRRMSKKHI
jgi:hypothetical protein